ncbi:right-handed parallel beta-helix repeat-containing protein [Flavobacteriaceae bacterium D16]|nr:right-handed parallel beta-helix repeat-containing protein [Flavobacteriaceae bacterium D16]
MSSKLYISIFLLLGILFMASPVMGQVTYSDTFSSVSYSNNDGTLNFSGGWVETNEGTDPSGGRIQINSNQLRFQNLDNRFITRNLDLSAAVSATLTLDFNRTNGNESILVQLWDGSSYNTVATLAGSGSVNYNLAANEMSAASSIRFITGSGNWGNSETIFVDNVLFTAVINPAISIDNVSVDEGAGTATFTATHVGQNTAGPFTVNYQTADITATAGSDYTAITGGVLSFNGTVGDTEQITVSITDDTLFESDETYRIEFTGSSDPSVSLGATGTGTITDNEVIFGNTPLALFREFDGYMDYTSTAGTLRTQPNTGNPCAITTASSNTLSAPIPAGATIEAAYLYWSHSGATADSQVTFEGSTVDGSVGYTSSILGMSFYGFFSDVTSIVQSIPNPTTNVYDFSGLTIDNTGNYCSYNVVLGGWALMIFYSDPSLPASTINLYQGFDGNQNSSSTFSLSGFYAIGSVGSKTSSLSWEGDQTLANNESLQFTTPLSGTNLLTGDGDNNGTTTNNPFNSTHFDNTVIPNVNNTASHGVDLDTYDVSAFILPGETSATTQVNVGQDYVIMNAVVLKVPSNLITGRVFEDVNYGGGAGRNYATASGVPISGATVELWDAGGSLVDTQTTDASGNYVFAGMIDGTYSVRVVNETVISSRPGGGACVDCMPVQTFKTEYITSTIVERTNEVGGADPTATDPSAGTLTGAQSVAAVTIVSEGVAGLDFGFNFNTIVNTNEDGQGSLELFVLNSNGLGETGLDIEANAIFDPAAGEDTSVFMIPPTGDALGRSADPNYASGIFDITLFNSGPLSDITGDNTIIDGRTQTAYSGDSNSGTIGAGGTNVGISAIALPNYELPEIQIHKNQGDVFRTQGNGVVIRNLAVYADNNSGIRVDAGSATINNNLLGVNASGANAGTIDNGIEVTAGTVNITGNYIATNTDSGILVDGGTTTVIQDNHITTNGDGPCDDNIQILSGTGITIQRNLIEAAAGLGIETDGYSGGLAISENTITTSGQDGGTCGGDIENAGIRLHGDNSSISNNVITANGGAGIVVAGGDTSGNLISQNSIYANGTTADALGIDIDNSNGVGDGVTLNENGDIDNGPNGSLNFPIITAAYVAGSNLVIKGWARPGATIEVFLTDINEGTATTGDNQLGFSTDYGEGQTYLGTVVEGSGADLDAGSSSYTDVDGNTDNTNRFHFSFTAPPSVALGDMVTATATLGNSTSEFSPMSILKVQTVITNRKITYRVNQD